MAIAKKPAKSALKPVIVRTYSAGVHFGYLVRRYGKKVTLERSRRLWRWWGAGGIALSGVATHGLSADPDKVSRVDSPVSIVLSEAIEVIEATAAAAASIEAYK